ncbi:MULTISPECIES: hypothetical protein [Bacillaceae]|uniref:Uncharacterized protein n=1 Tax=Evansella alkalicola TaxID=745819 RepID=A0ABS6K1S1_9BACI|nr:MULTISPECIES: hypothetical protein [Bacillaceae]MBU9723387.1 hypothetical protein [Bacillus alkalicola]
MYRIISFFVIFSFVATTLYFYQESRHHHSHPNPNPHDHPHTQDVMAHGLGSIDIPEEQAEDAPTIEGVIHERRDGVWQVTLKTSNFTFTPEKAGLTGVEQRLDEGHAHLYINGEKIGSIFEQKITLPSLAPGTYEIKISLNGHNHEVFTLEGKEIAFKTEVTVTD